MSCFSHQRIRSNMPVDLFQLYGNTSNKLCWPVIEQCCICSGFHGDRLFFFISKASERRQERKWVEQGREEYMSVEVEIWLTSLHSCRSLWDSSTWLRLNCVPDINKGVSVRADQQLRGSSRGPDWGLSSEGKDLTQNRYKICKGGHGLGIKDWRGEAITPETPRMTKLEGRRRMCQFHRFTSSHILHQSQLV